MLIPLRLGLRRLSVELVILLSACLVLCVVAAVIALAIGRDNEILRSCLSSDDCSAMNRDLDMWRNWALYLRVALVGLPVLTGAVIGTSLVASEFEQGTAAFAWTVIPRRRTWLKDASTTGLLALLLVAVPVALAGAGVSAALGPQADPGYAPAAVDMAPVLLAVRGILTFSLAVLIGMIVGRALPSLMFSILLALGLLVVVEVAFAVWRDGAAVPIDASAPGTYFVSDAAIGSDGQVISIADADATAAALGRNPDELYPSVQVGLTPGTRLSMLAIESGLVLVISAGALIAADLLAARRRPV